MPGDTVRLLGLNGAVTRNFVLGPYLGGGVMGRVFYLANSNPPQVIKLQRGGAQARMFMEKEIEAMEALTKKNIPHPEMTASNPAVFVVKEYVPGKYPVIITLGESDAILVYKNFSLHGRLASLIKTLVRWRYFFRA